MNKSKRSHENDALERAYHRAAEAMGAAGRIGTTAVRTALRLPGLGRPHPRVPRRTPGAPPGIESLAAEVEALPAPIAEPAQVECVDFSPSRVESRTVDDLDIFFREPRPEWATVRWINVVGLDAELVGRFHEAFDLHTLAAEDVLHVPQRPRVEPYANHLYVVARMLMLQGEHLVSEQISMFLSDDTLLTFQERPGDVWEPIRKRLRSDGSRVRENDASFLLYTLLDSLVDHVFPILEHYAEVFEDLEDTIMEEASPEDLRRVQNLKRELVLLRKVMWPTRQLLDELHRGDIGGLPSTTRTFLRDVYGHSVQIIDVIETYREVASGLSELYMSAVSNRMNEIMKVLTMMATIFIPVTFLAGVYGMNFRYLPELSWHYGYATFWAVCAAVTLALVVYFHRKGWIG